MSHKKLKLLAGLAVLSVIFIFLRAKNLGHLLMWDEAWNILSLKARLAGAVKDPFYWYYSFHPPLYMLFAGLLDPFAAGFDIRAEMLSLAFSYCTFLSVYFLCYRIGGWRYAVLSGIFLCFLPEALAYDTWIKRDCLAMAFGYLSLLLLLDKKYIWCAVLLGLSLLSKESGFFFALAAAGLFLLSDEKKKIRLLFVSALVTLAVSGWWYVLYSNLAGDVGSFYFSEAVYGKNWAGTPLYYARKLLPDLGIGGLVFFVIGLAFLPYFAYIKRRPEISLPVLMTLCVYLPISLVFTAKTPWLSYTAAPALAMTAGGGALFLLGRTHFSRIIRVALFALIFLTVYTGMEFSYEGYHMTTYPHGWRGAKVSEELAEYLNGQMGPGDRLMITDFAYWRMPLCAVFYYYCRPHPVTFIRGSEDPAEVLKKIRKENISWLVIADSPDPEYNFHPLVKGMTELLGEPKQAGWSFVWKTK